MRQRLELPWTVQQHESNWQLGQKEFQRRGGIGARLEWIEERGSKKVKTPTIANSLKRTALKKREDSS